MANLTFAWLVHFYTAFGAVVGLYTILAIDEANFRLAFLLMAVTVIIDATDGALARAARVKAIIPWFDGALLDNLVDYLELCNRALPVLMLRARLAAGARRALARRPAGLVERLRLLPTGRQNRRSFLSRLSILLEHRVLLSIRAPNRALDQRLFDHRSLDPGLRADALYLPQPRAALSFANQYPRRAFGAPRFSISFTGCPTRPGGFCLPRCYFPPTIRFCRYGLSCAVSWPRAPRKPSTQNWETS